MTKRAEINRIFGFYSAFNKSMVSSIASHSLFATFFGMIGLGASQYLIYPQGIYNPAQIDPISFYKALFYMMVGPAYALHRIYSDQDTLLFRTLPGRLLYKLKALFLSTVVKGSKQALVYTGLFSIGYLSFGYFWWRALGMVLRLVGYS